MIRAVDFDIEAMEARAVAIAMSATDEQLIDGQSWYLRNGRLLAEIDQARGLAPGKMAAMVAAVSPGCRWLRNICDAIALLDDDHAATGCYGGADGLHARRARAIRDGADPDQVLGGDKVRAFWLALVGDDQAIVIDRHMARALLPDVARELGHEAIHHLCNTPNKYGAMAESIRRAAEYLEMAPRELQALIWIVQSQERLQ